ncbi:MAG: hypothetical protein J6Y69_11675, partial [Treponema sp.]|nr:hypothetical protein [Treponema sp.]
MRKLRNCIFSFASLLLLFGLFSSCNEPVREYLEYWSSTCQVGKIEYISDNTELDGTPNLSALSQMEINLYLINPKSYEILTNPGGAPCFHFKDQNGSSTFYSEYSETAMDRNTTIKIRATLPDDTEGQTITLTGCIWPENRSSLGFSEDELKTSFPELFYTTTFVQNTPPDNVRNMNTSGTGEFYSGTNKHYLYFTLPDLSLKRNHGSRYEINTYLRETDGELYYTGSEIISLDDSDPGNRTFLYYYAEQEDSLFYEYTVQVLGPRGLSSEMLCTDERLGVHQLTEPTITIQNEFNGLEDEQGYKCIEVASNDGTVSYTAAAADPNDTLTVKVDGVEVTDENFTVSGIGQHTIEAISSKDGSRPQSVIKKIRIVKTPDPATFTFATDENTYFNGFTDTNGNEYLEVPTSTSTAGYTISPTEEGTTVSGTVDGNAYSAPIDNGTLTAGQSHTLVATIHKQYCNDVTTTRKIMVAKQLEEPVFQFNTNGLSGNTINGFLTIEVPTLTSKESYKIKPAAADSGARISSAEGSSITFSETTEKTGQLGINEYTIKVTVSKNYMRSKTFTKKIKVVLQLQEPTYSFTPNLTGSKTGDYEWVEVPDGSTPVNYTITAEPGCTLEIASSSSLGNSSTTVNTNTHNDNLASLGGTNSRDYTWTITVKKQNYNPQTFYKKIKVIKELQEPTIRFYKDSAHSEEAASHTNPENSSYRSPYVSYDINLADDGTGYLYYTATSPDGAIIKITDVQNSPGTEVNGKLAIGPHKLLIEVSKTNYKTKTFSDSVKPVYVQGILSAATFTPIGTKTGVSITGDTEYWQYSYIEYDEMPINVSVGNTGNTLEIHEDGH